MKFTPEELHKEKGIAFVGVSTVFFCHDGRGKFLMSKRSQSCRDEKGRWEIPAGGLKWGVTAEDNIKREVKEELCTDVKQVDFLGYRDMLRINDEGIKTHWLALDFAVLVDPAQVKIGEPDKCDEIGWFKPSSLPSPLHSQQAVFMKKYSESIGSILKT